MEEAGDARPDDFYEVGDVACCGGSPQWRGGPGLTEARQVVLLPSLVKTLLHGCHQDLEGSLSEKPHLVSAQMLASSSS